MSICCSYLTTSKTSLVVVHSQINQSLSTPESSLPEIYWSLIKESNRILDVINHLKVLSIHLHSCTNKFLYYKISNHATVVVKKFPLFHLNLSIFNWESLSKLKDYRRTPAPESRQVKKRTTTTARSWREKRDQIFFFTSHINIYPPFPK